MLEQAQKNYDWHDNTFFYDNNYSTIANNGPLTTKQNATRIWDRIQNRGKCCGISVDATDWTRFIRSNGINSNLSSEKKFPRSCCPNPAELNHNLLLCKFHDTPKLKSCLDVIIEPLTNLAMIIYLPIIAKFLVNFVAVRWWLTRNE